MWPRFNISKSDQWFYLSRGIIRLNNVNISANLFYYPPIHGEVKSPCKLWPVLTSYDDNTFSNIKMIPVRFINVKICSKNTICVNL